MEFENQVKSVKRITMPHRHNSPCGLARQETENEKSIQKQSLHFYAAPFKVATSASS